MASEYSCHPTCVGACSMCAPQVLCAGCGEPIDGEPSSLVDGDTVHTEDCAAEYAAEAAKRNFDPEGLGLWNPDAKRWRRLGPEVMAEWTESTVERATGDVWVWVK